MPHRYRSVLSCLAAALGSACLNGEAPTQTDDIGLTTAALSVSVCNETVPANRNIDGIPSYAQCADSNNSAIFSNNGIDTSATQMGSDWVRTQWSGGYQCTELAHRYLHFKWGVKWIPNGNAGMWCDSQPPASSGVVQTMTPVHGDVMVLAPGSCGADGTTGHVTVVDVVADSKLTVVEQNGARRGNYMLSCAKCFLHVMANNGTPSPIAGAATAGAAAPATTPPAMQGAAGGGAMPTMPGSSGLPGRGRPGMTGTMAGAAGTPAAMTRPAATPPAMAPITPPAAAPTTPSSTTAMNGLAAAGSGAAMPLASAVTTPSTSTRAAAPTASACAVAAVGGERSSGLALAFSLSAIAGLVIRRRPRRA